jgi:eukaryotic-like serine/threonine-protein kinase
MRCPSCQAENAADAHKCTRCGGDFTAATAVSPTVRSVVVSVDLSPGAIFANRYEIVRPLGHGGMGMVYLARDRTLDEVLAIKILRPDFASDPAMAQRFRSEIKLARRVRHKNVAAIHDYGDDGGLLFISMEFVDGQDLKQLLRKRGALPPSEAYELAIQVTEGLQAVHDAGVIHRDLKTPNIMLDAKGVARLMDFGIAKQHNAEGATGTGNIVGTPEYMSPEQAQGRRVDFRCDIYAMGVVVYELFSGQVPFRGETPIATILKHIQEPPTLEGPTAPLLPPPLIPVLRKALAKEPDQRYSSAHELAEALRSARTPLRKQELLSTHVLQAPTMRQRPVEPPASRRWIGLAAAALAAGAGTYAALTWGPNRKAVDEKTPVATASPSLSPSPPPAAESPTPERTLPPVAAAAATAAPAPRPTPRPLATRPATLTLAPTAPPTVPPTAPPTPSPAPTAAAAVSNEPGWLLLAISPWANVSIDGVNKGSTPMDKLSLAAGRRRVVLEYPGYEAHEEILVIRPGQTEKLRFNFETQGTKKK